MQIIIAIAMICQVSAGDSWGSYSEGVQKTCQKELAKCAADKRINSPDTLRDIEQMIICVRDRK